MASWMTMTTPEFSKARFFEAIKYVPHPGQVQIHGAFAEPGVKTVLACCGVRFGKSKAAAAEMAFEAVRPRAGTPVNPKGEFMGWVVSFDHASAKVVFGMVYDILKDYLHGHVNKNESEGIITFVNLSGARGTIMRRTTQDAGGKGKLTSYAVDFIVVDEAAKIRQGIDIWENQLATRLIDRQGRSLHISTPMGVEGYFAELYRKGQEQNKEGLISLQLPSWVNPYLPREELVSLKRKLREAAYRQEVGAELLADSGMVFNRDDVLKVCHSEFEDPIPDAEYFGGIDLGLTNDFTVVTLARQPLKGEIPAIPRVVGIWRFHRMHVAGQINKIRSISDRFNGAQFNVDENGIGKSIFEQMVTAGIPCRPIYTTGTGAVSKVNQITHAMTIVEQGRLMLPRADLIPVYLKELTTYQWEITPSGNKTANAPEGSHDDCVASFLLTCWWLPPSDGSAVGQVWHRGMATRPEPKPIAGKKPRPELKVSGDADPEDVEDLIHVQKAQRERRNLWGGVGRLGLGRWGRGQ